VVSRELGLGAADLGLLAGAYFLGFSAMQLPLGEALDRYGPRWVLPCLLLVAAMGCAAFAAASGKGQMLLARLVLGVGVSACLMAPLTFFRHHFSPAAQLRANSWMLMTGSLGMLASTLPAQWLLPAIGWRGLFGVTGSLLLLACVLLVAVVPSGAAATNRTRAAVAQGYAEVFQAEAFRRVAPAGFFCYGGLIALQSLWIGPWLTEVGGRTPDQAAAGLFVVNASMLAAFLTWGLVMPRLIRAGWTAERLIGRGWPLSVGCLAFIIWRGPAAGPIEWATWCVFTSVVSLSQPAVAQAFAPSLAGRALSAFNLMIFFGVFAVQWGLGLLIEAMMSLGCGVQGAYQAAFGVYLAACVASIVPLLPRGQRPPSGR
jgi:MFS family permease